MAQEVSSAGLETNGAWSLGSGLIIIALAAVALFLPEIEWAPRGGLVGWLLVLAGSAEVAFASRRGRDLPGRTAILSGLLTALAGLLFVTNPLAGYFPVANVVMAWLVVRGSVVLVMALKPGRSAPRAWLALSGSADLLLGLVLLAGWPVAALVVSLFGPTPEIVARFSLILALSLFVTGISQAAIGLSRRRAR